VRAEDGEENHEEYEHDDRPLHEFRESAPTLDMLADIHRSALVIAVVCHLKILEIRPLEAGRTITKTPPPATATRWRERSNFWPISYPEGEVIDATRADNSNNFPRMKTVMLNK
jgi:hypothetical protein